MNDSAVRIGPYEVLARLGQGGMAETYLAQKRGPGEFVQRVCLKRIRADLAGDPDFVRQFMAEAATAARLRHTAIAQVVDFGQAAADYYLALELVEGLDLRGLLDALSAPLPAELVLHLAIELGSALDFAHRGGSQPGAPAVVHRDVSPSNVLLSTEGEVKLTDFGIARAIGSERYTETGIVKGKVPYLAPEYARSGRFDVRCDLFSLGVLLYECLCGERPHQGATELETLELAAAARHTPLAQRVSGAPAVLTDAIERLLDPDPESRWPSAALLLETLSTMPTSRRARRELSALVVETRNTQRLNACASPVALELGPTLALDAKQDLQQAALAPTRTRLNPKPELSSAPSASLEVAGLRRRRPLIALAIASTFAAGVLLVALSRGAFSDPHSRAATPAADHSGAASPRTPPPPIVIPPVPEPVTMRAPASQRAAAAQPNAVLEVVVLPYGEVRVDGKRAGKAPLSVTLAPGEHAIEGRNPDGRVRRTIELAPGERRQLVLR